VSFIPLVERYFAALEEAGEVRLARSWASAMLTRRRSTQLEDRGIEPLPVEFPDVRPAVQRAQKAFLREQAVRLCRRGLQQLVKLTQERRTAHQILKSALLTDALPLTPAADALPPLRRPGLGLPESLAHAVCRSAVLGTRLYGRCVLAAAPDAHCCCS